MRDTGTLSALLVTGKGVGDPRVPAARGGIACRPLSVHCIPRDFGKIILLRSCLSYFSVTVIKPHDSGNSQRDGLTGMA